MAKLKSLTVGHRVVAAGRRRKCYHNAAHSILKDEECLEVRVGMKWKGYCLECARRMVDDGLTALAQLQTRLRD
jgi:hypothetical protein